MEEVGGVQHISLMLISHIEQDYGEEYCVFDLNNINRETALMMDTEEVLVCFRNT